MPDSIVHEILERIDETNKPIVLSKRDIEKYSADELEHLLSRGILLKELHPGSFAAGARYSDDGEREPVVIESTPESFYKVDILRLLEVIRKDNALTGDLRNIEGRLFELGEKKFHGFPPIRIYLSLRNQDVGWLDSVCSRIRRRPETPAVLLVPRWILMSQESDDQNRSSGMFVLYLSDCVTSDFWKLPWNNLRADIKAALAISKVDTIPGDPIVTPMNTEWKEVRITMTDHDLTVYVGDQTKAYSFQDAGFEEKRRGDIPDIMWLLLTLFARRRGVLTRDDEALDRDQRKQLTTRVSSLRKRMRALVPTIDGDPIPYDFDKGCYSAAFQISSQEKIQISTPAGTQWPNVSIVEVKPHVISVSFSSLEKCAASTYTDDSRYRRHRWEAAERLTQEGHKYNFQMLGLADETGKVSPTGKAILDVLRNRGSVKRSQNDNEMLSLVEFLHGLLNLKDSPFDISKKDGTWRARFEASSEIGSKQ